MPHLAREVRRVNRGPYVTPQRASFAAFMAIIPVPGCGLSSYATLAMVIAGVAVTPVPVVVQVAHLRLFKVIVFLVMLL